MPWPGAGLVQFEQFDLERLVPVVEGDKRIVGARAPAVGLETNVSNLTLHATTKCLHNLRIHFGTQLARFTASSPIAVRWSSGRTCRASLLASGSPRRFAGDNKDARLWTEKMQGSVRCGLEFFFREPQQLRSSQ